MNLDSGSKKKQFLEPTCLVAGGAGYIGSNICYELIQSGYRVIVVDNFDNSNPGVIDELKQLSVGQSGSLIFPGPIDLLQKGSITHLLSSSENISVINLAGLKSVGDSVSDPLLYYKTNLEIMLNILDSMNLTGCRKLVFSSSATVYGSESPIPLDEHNPIGRNIANPYGFTKCIIENMLENLCQFDPKWSIVSLRYFNPVGMGGNSRIRLADRPTRPAKNIMPAIFESLCNPDKPLHIYGNDYSTRDGTAERDYIHVSDLAQAHLIALNKLQSGYDFYNVGLGYPVSVLELIATVEKVQGTKVNYVVDPRREGDVPISYASTKKIRKELGWEPKKLVVDEP